MIYKAVIDTINFPEIEEVNVNGVKLLKDHAIFFEADKENELPTVEGVGYKQQIDELPEHDLFGDKIVIHKLRLI